MMDTMVADYSRVIAFLDRARLPAYVSFVERASARGVSREDETRQRISVRISDGTIVVGAPPAGTGTSSPSEIRGGNPFGKRAFFQPGCYEATSENETTWQGRAALRFDLRPTCSNGSGLAQLYADPQTLRPIAVAASFNDADSSAVDVAVELRYTTVAQYTVPSGMDVRVRGRGWLTWVREHGELTYSEYEFHHDTDFMRRQATAP